MVYVRIGTGGSPNIGRERNLVFGYVDGDTDYDGGEGGGRVIH